MILMLKNMNVKKRLGIEVLLLVYSASILHVQTDTVVLCLIREC